MLLAPWRASDSLDPWPLRTSKAPHARARSRHGRRTWTWHVAACLPLREILAWGLLHLLPGAMHGWHVQDSCDTALMAALLSSSMTCRAGGHWGCNGHGWQRSHSRHMRVGVQSQQLSATVGIGAAHSSQ